VYFITRSQLDPADGNDDQDIYRWDEESAESTCLTCEVSPDAKVEGQVMVSDDFSHIYFKSSAQLVPGEGQGSNLYVLSEGTVKFVADSGRLLGDFAKLSEDGNMLAFHTQASPSLTADTVEPECINADPDGGFLGDCEELYLYNDTDGSIECISCRHGGATSHSLGAEPSITDVAYQLSADGSTVAFSTWEALVPLDVNQDSDIYEWRNGAVRLITDGVTDQPGFFSAPQVLGLDSDGSNLLFALVPPRGKLTGFEQDALLNLYDARIGGGFEPPSPPVHCSEDSCQGPLQAAPSPGPQASAGFSGAGNLAPQVRKRRPCARKRGKAKQQCIRRHKRQSRKAGAHHNAGRVK
jgi:hypothetical protein